MSMSMGRDKNAGPIGVQSARVQLTPSQPLMHVHLFGIEHCETTSFTHEHAIDE